MTVYIDPPRWPAHGTVFSHLVSDTSLEQLHAFARSLGVSIRAFDEDHYDVPAHRHGAAVAHGAVAVDGKQLARILIRSGLRIPARRRPAKISAALAHRWDRHFPEHPDLGRELLQRWQQGHRQYHGPAHLLHVLESLDRLTGADPHPELVLAAWFHDAVHEGRDGQDERESAELAHELLSAWNWPAATAGRVADLVLVTAHHDPDLRDENACLLVDADLAVLGGTPQEYARYREAVRQEYAHVPEDQFRAARAGVLRTLRALPHLFHHPVAVQLWEDRARQNLDGEIAALTGS